jgi:Holliday junction resolvase RusA-like endonuclease
VLQWHTWDSYDVTVLTSTFSLLVRFFNPLLYNKQQSTIIPGIMTNHHVEDIMIVSSDKDKKYGTISFDISGSPPVQKRACINYKMRNKPTLYDPSSKEKIEFRNLIQKAMEEMGLKHSPFFDRSQAIKLEVVFIFPRPRNDFGKRGQLLPTNLTPFPKSKDLDNLVKFIGDAMQGLLFHNDASIDDIQARKEFDDRGTNSGIKMAFSGYFVDDAGI